jgi:hypothetical protein
MGNSGAETPIIWDYYEMLGFLQELRALHFRLFDRGIRLAAN